MFIVTINSRNTDTHARSMRPILCKKDLIVKYNGDKNSIRRETIDLIKIIYPN